MDRAELVGMLAGRTAGCAPARAALLDGGDFVVRDGSVPARELADIYAARLRRARKRGTETLALPSAVDTLTRLGDARVRTGRIRTPDGAWTFMIFLADDASGVLACSGVRRAEGRRSSPDVRIPSQPWSADDRLTCTQVQGRGLIDMPGNHLGASAEPAEFARALGLLLEP